MTQDRNRTKRAARTTAISTSWTRSTTTPQALMGRAGSEPHINYRLSPVIWRIRQHMEELPDVPVRILDLYVSLAPGSRLRARRDHAPCASGSPSGRDRSDPGLHLSEQSQTLRKTLWRRQHHRPVAPRAPGVRRSRTDRSVVALDTQLALTAFWANGAPIMGERGDARSCHGA